MSESVGVERLNETFKALKAQGKKALVLYLMGGDPSPGFTERLLPKLADVGVDVVELGFPFSDPVADGPVIQSAATRALHKFGGLPDFLAMIKRIRSATSIPLVTMTYYNPIFRYGEAEFARDALAAGLDGAIIPDMPVDEAQSWVATCRESGLAPILLEAPTTDENHARLIAEKAGGFIYLVSLKGVTGTDVGIGENLGERVERFRAHTQTPLMVGFGISTPLQARDVGRISDGVVVGSSAVRRIEKAATPQQAEKAVLKYMAEMRAGLDS